MNRLLANLLLGLGGFLAFVCIASPVVAGDNGPAEVPCYWCVRDAIYADVDLIDHLEANPDIDEGIKGPQIIAARADIHRLRALLGPPVQTSAAPCCYSRKRLYIR